MAITREWNRHQLFMADEIIDKLIEFASQHDPFLGMSESTLRTMFEVYQKTTLIFQADGEIRGYGVYQEWPDCLNFICIAGKNNNREESLKAMLVGRHQLPNKKICYFDEEKMELKVIWQPKQ